MDVFLIVLLSIFIVTVVGLFITIIFLNRQTVAKFEDTYKTINEKLIATEEGQKQTTQSFGQIQKTLGQLGEASRHMEDVGKEISGLSDIFRAPKLRGGIGELLLGDLLAQILPPDNYELQYSFKGGQRVDAAIKVKAGLVPVDSKFPLESFRRLIGASDDEKSKFRKEFNRSVQKHIDDIAQKYILPDEGTFDFALMYIPAENVYYETILNEQELDSTNNLLEYAMEKRVIPVSPNSFYAYLQVILLGLRGLQIEKQAQEILGYLGRLGNDFSLFKDQYETLGTHLRNASNKYVESGRILNNFENKLSNAKLSSGSTSTSKENKSDFWREVLKLRGKDLRTLAQKQVFSVLEVSNNNVFILVHSTNNRRDINRKEIEGAYKYLTKMKELTLKEIRNLHSEANPTYVAAILSEIPNVKSVSNPKIKLFYTSL